MVKKVFMGLFLAVVVFGVWKGKRVLDMMLLQGTWTADDGRQITVATGGPMLLRIAYPGSEFGEGEGNYSMREGVDGVPLWFEGRYEVSAAPYLVAGQTATISGMSQGGRMARPEDVSRVEFRDLTVRRAGGGRVEITTGAQGELTISRVFRGERTGDHVCDFAGMVQGGLTVVIRRVQKGELQVEGAIQGTFRKENAWM